MCLEIGNYVFEGPYSDADYLEDRPGIFVVFCHLGDDFRGLDCEVTREVRKAVVNHGRQAQWQAICQGSVEYAVLYANENLDEVEKMLREQFKFPCRDASQSGA